MLNECLPLNVLASKRRDNEPVDFDEKKAITNSLESCEQATSDFDESLKQAKRQTADR